MTTYLFSQNLISIVADLSRDIPDEIRYKRLLDAMQSIFPCDAAALLADAVGDLRRVGRAIEPPHHVSRSREEAPHGIHPRD